jgi:hypothetical protein
VSQELRAIQTWRCWIGVGSRHGSSAKPRGRPMPPHIARATPIGACVRNLVEHIFAAEKRRMGLLVRTIGLTCEFRRKAARYSELMPAILPD